MSSDSENSDEEDVFDTPSQNIKVNNEHSDPDSYSWIVLKLAAIKICQTRLLSFLSVINSQTEIFISFIEFAGCWLRTVGSSRSYAVNTFCN